MNNLDTTLTTHQYFCVECMDKEYNLKKKKKERVTGKGDMLR